MNQLCIYFHSTDLFDCPKCGKKLRDFYAELKFKCDAVPKELKQEFLNFLKDGKNIGDAIIAIDPQSKYEDIVWFNIFGNQIENHGYKTFNFQIK